MKRIVCIAVLSICSVIFFNKTVAVFATPPTHEQCTYQLGAELSTITPQMRQLLGIGALQGVYVVCILPETAAASSNLQAGDVITAIDNVPVSDVTHVQRFIQNSPGYVTLTLMRNGVSCVVSVKLKPVSGGSEPAA
jgi:S1-C subfamily serine protease